MNETEKCFFQCEWEKSHVRMLKLSIAKAFSALSRPVVWEVLIALMAKQIVLKIKFV